MWWKKTSHAFSTRLEIGKRVRENRKFRLEGVCNRGLFALIAGHYVGGNCWTERKKSKVSSFSRVEGEPSTSAVNDPGRLRQGESVGGGGVWAVAESRPILLPSGRNDWLDPRILETSSLEIDRIEKSVKIDFLVHLFFVSFFFWIELRSWRHIRRGEYSF